MKKTINILLADDHSMIRHGMALTVEEIVADSSTIHASNLQQVSEILDMQEIDFAIIDAIFPNGNSLDYLPEIRRKNPDLKIMIYSGIDETKYALKYINAGADGFLSKLADEDEVAEAIEKMIEYGEYLSANTQSLLIQSHRNPGLVNALYKLSRRELQIARLYAEGLGNIEIANNLNIKQNTVSTLKKRIFDKLEIENFVQLLALMKDDKPDTTTALSANS